MSEEKEKTEFEETVLDHSTTDESGGAVDEKKLTRKLDRYLLPGLTLLLTLSFLDRGNVGNALIEGLVVDLRMTGTQLLIALSINLVTYVLFEIPSNIILKLTSPRFWLPTLTLIWGISCVLTGVTQNFPGFLVVRFFIGAVDSGFIPGCLFYISMWYKRDEQIYRTCLMFSVALLAGALGGVLAFGISKMRGIAGLNGWRWIFIIEGLLTVLIAIAAYFFMHDYPATARFLTPKEKKQVIARLKGDSDAGREEKFTWGGVIHALKDPKVWLYTICLHTILLPTYTLGIFLPTIINGLGYTAAQAQLLSAVPSLAASILTMTTVVFVERINLRAPFIIAGSTLSIIGYLVLITGDRPEVSYGGAIMASAGTFVAGTLIMCWPAINVSGQTKRATAGGLQLSVANTGAVLGTQLYRPEWGAKFHVAQFTAVGYLAANVIVVGILWYVLRNENARRDRGERDHRLQDVDEGVFLGDDDPRWRFRT